jgi:hypothetical protein
LAQVQYDNFDLQILSTGSGYEARVIASPAGEGKCSFSVPFTPEELEHLTPYPNRNSREIKLKQRLESNCLPNVATSCIGSILKGRLHSRLKSEALS